MKFRLKKKAVFSDKVFHINSHFMAAPSDIAKKALSELITLAYKLSLRDFVYGKFSDGKLRWVAKNSLEKI